ncbi:MAG: diaminopimelate epimerase [Hyphomonadaceae bacterium]|nr:diaminopimelate epimerase [Hyphomonadaceae bacterium]
MAWMRMLKMNGAGNAFVILDARAQGAAGLTGDQARALADPAAHGGADQVIALERSDRADVFMRIWNASGEEVSACGNGTRAVGWILIDEGKPKVTIETRAGILRAESAGGAQVTVDMGSPLLKWEEIPLARAMDTVRMDYAIDHAGVRLAAPGAANMGNPHVVFFVDDMEALPIRAIGPIVEHDSLFPERANVGFCQVRARDRMRLRVWERGAGLTKACGTGACAAVVAAHRRGLVDRACTVTVDGGVLEIDWRATDDRVRMTGPVELERVGEVAL